MQALTSLDSVLKKQRHHFAEERPYSPGYGLSSSHVWLWELDHKEGRAPKNWYSQTVVLEKTFDSPLDSKKLKPVNFKSHQLWIVTGRVDAKAEVQIFGTLMQRADSLEKTLMLGKIEGRRKSGQ